MTVPSNPHDRVETGAQASGGDNPGDERDAFCAGKTDYGETSRSELSAARDALKRAEDNMVSAVNRVQDQSKPLLTYGDAKGAIGEYHAAADRVRRARSYADVVAPKESAPENARAGMKRGSDPVERRCTGEDTRRAPAERPREDEATPMEVNGDGAFARGQKGTRSTFRVRPGPGPRRVFLLYLSGSDAPPGLRPLRGDARCLRRRGARARFRDPRE